MKIGLYFKAVVIGSLIATPALAADPRNLAFSDQLHGSASTYVGVSVSLNGNRTKGLSPAFGLDAGVRPRGLESRPSTSLASRTPLFELQPAAGGAEIRLRGRSLSATGKGDGFGAGTILLAIAAAAGAVFLVSEIADSDNDHDDDRCLIEPELCD
jgi:hypothetical protein